MTTYRYNDNQERLRLSRSSSRFVHFPPCVECLFQETFLVVERNQHYIGQKRLQWMWVKTSATSVEAGEFGEWRAPWIVLVWKFHFHPLFWFVLFLSHFSFSSPTLESACALHCRVDKRRGLPHLYLDLKISSMKHVLS